MSVVWRIEKARGRGRIATPRRVEALSRQMVNAVRGDFARGIEKFRPRVDPAEMLAAFKRGKYDAVRKVVPWEALGEALQPGIRRLGQAMSLGANTELPLMPGRLSYSLRNETVGQYLRTRTGVLITTSEAGMLESVRAATEKSFTRAATPQQVADMLRSSIGLNAPQARALANYRTALATAKSPAAPERIDSLVEGYRERLLDQRAIMIGRSEVRFAQNAGQKEVWDAAEAEGLLPAGSGREWVVDGNPCPELCLPMSGVVVALDEPYTLPDGREVMNPTESHPNCYCIERLVFGQG